MTILSYEIFFIIFQNIHFQESQDAHCIDCTFNAYIALMFGKNTTQRNICEFLCQIRSAIYKDFVPHFLGAKRKRVFFLNFNTITSHEIHDLEKDC
jgi:hypothetical protein